MNKLLVILGGRYIEIFFFYSAVKANKVIETLIFSGKLNHDVNEL